MTRLEILSPRDELMAWTLNWTLSEHQGVKLVTTKTLHLEQDTALEFMAGRSFITTFAGAHLAIGDTRYGLLVLHSAFNTWKDGMPDLTGVAFALLEKGKPFDARNLGGLVEKSAIVLGSFLHS